MISRSAGHRASLLFVLRVAARSAPMTGINRSALSRRTLLFLLVLLGTPMAAGSATLEDSAKELARKIIAAMTTHEEASLDIRKESSIGPDDFAVIENNLKGELQALGVRITGNAGAPAKIAVTLSENMSSFVWTAEIRQADSSQVVFLAFPKPSENHAVSRGMPVTLHSEKFWEGSQRVLDAAIVALPNGVSLLLLLTPDALLIRNVGSDQVSTVAFPPSAMATRDPMGALTQSGKIVSATTASQICNIDTFSRALMECHPRPVDGPPTGRMFESLIALAKPGPVHVERGSQVTAVPNSCGNGLQYLASGQGDYTESDTILLFESEVTQGVISEKALSDFLHFPGPVMSIQSDGAPPRAIVRNLQTGNYEAYKISISCTQ